MKRLLTSVAALAVMFASGCTNEAIDATPSSLTAAEMACESPESAPTTELSTLAGQVRDYSRNASDIVARTIEVCTYAAVSRGVELGDTTPFAPTQEWYARAPSEIRRRCAALEGPLLAGNPMTVRVELLGCVDRDACADPFDASARCQGGRAFGPFVGAAESSPPDSSLLSLVFYLPQSIRRTKAPISPGPQTYAPSPRSILCDRAIREAAVEATDRWASSLAAAAEAVEGVARAARVQTTCTVVR
ncbi:MAG: hypothetical protein JST00_31450 [Deltaproteobacteria bacterium]|nr:hypothetical protein [Deltaproteobacteria bacterium]